MGPPYLPARRLLGAACLKAGRSAEALAALSTAADSAGAPIALAWLAHAKGVTGDLRGAQRAAAALEELAGTRYVPPDPRARAMLGVGNRDEALAALEQARRDADPALAYAALEPRFTPIRNDTRFGRLLEQIGL